MDKIKVIIGELWWWGWRTSLWVWTFLEAWNL